MCASGRVCVCARARAHTQPSSGSARSGNPLFLGGVSSRAWALKKKKKKNPTTTTKKPPSKKENPCSDLSPKPADRQPPSGAARGLTRLASARFLPRWFPNSTSRQPAKREAAGVWVPGGVVDSTIQRRRSASPGVALWVLALQGEDLQVCVCVCACTCACSVCRRLFQFSPRSARARQFRMSMHLVVLQSRCV